MPSDRHVARGRRDRTVLVLLVGILVGAAAVRLYGLRYGFPLLVHPDEFAVVDAVVDMAKRNSFEPPWSYRPDHVEMKVDYFVFAAYAAVFKGSSIEAAFAADPLPFYYLARLMTAVFGVATVLLAYLVGARWSRKVGLVAAALFAFFPALVLHAHYATPDVPLTFAVMLLIYALMRYVDSTSWASLLVASFAVALAVGIKYPGAVGAVMIAVVVGAAAVRDRAPRRFALHGLAAAGASVGFLFLISPTLFTNISGIREELKVQAAGDRLGHPDHGFLGNLKFYVVDYLDTGGLVLGLLAVVGLVVVVRRRRLDTVPWFAGLLVWLSLSTLPMTWERWGLPMWVTPLLLAAVGMSALVEWFWERARTRWLPAVAFAVVAVQLALGTATADGTLVADDTRHSSLTWLEDSEIRPAESTYEGYTPFLPDRPALFVEKQVKDTADGYAFYTTKGEPASYVIVSSGMYARVLNDPNYAREQAVYHYIFDNLDEVASFPSLPQRPPSMWEPVSVTRHLELLGDLVDGADTGPTIMVYEIPPELRAE